MSDTRDREIAELEARIMALRSEPDPEPAAPEPDRDPDGMPAGWAALHEELASQEREPEPEPASDPQPEPQPMYAASRHPDLAHELITASGHGVGGHGGLGAGVSN